MSEQPPERTIRDLVNTPFKKAMFVVQILSYVLIVGSPVIGGAVGGLLGLRASRIGGLILAIFIAGEVLFYGSLIFLGKELVLLIRDKVRRWFRRSSGKEGRPGKTAGGNPGTTTRGNPTRGDEQKEA
ncbi:MAG: hypothetical protein ACWGNV_09505 [Bacteroidales bacterium]